MHWTEIIISPPFNSLNCPKNPATFVGHVAGRLWGDQYALQEVANAEDKHKLLYDDIESDVAALKTGIRGSGKEFQLSACLNVSPVINLMVKKAVCCRIPTRKKVTGGGVGCQLLLSQCSGVLIRAHGVFAVRLNWVSCLNVIKARWTLRAQRTPCSCSHLR